MAEFPSARDALFELIDGKSFDGKTTTAYFRRPADFTDHLPAVAIYPLPGGVETVIDRTDRIGVDVYAVGTDSMHVAEAVRSVLCDGYPGRETSAGYLDRIWPESLPTDVPYADPTVTQTQTVYRVTARPSA